MEVKDCQSCFIPEDLVCKIFLRLPVKSLLRFRCVSRFFCSTIDSFSFANRHISTRATVPAEGPQFLSLPVRDQSRATEKVPSFILDGNVIKENGYPILEFSLSEVEDHVIYHCCHVAYGLICFRNRGGETILCNPLRGEVLELPKKSDNIGMEWYGIGFDSDRTTKTYQILRVFFSRSGSSWGFLATEILTLGSSSWRRISSIPSAVPSKKGVSAYGDMHWMRMRNHNTNENRLIITFDFKKEEFKWTPHPDFQLKSYENCVLINVRGSLAIIKISYSPFGCYMEIWMLKDYEKKNWVKLYRMLNKGFKPISMVNGVSEVEGLYNYNVRIYLLDLKTNSVWHMQCPKKKRTDGLILGYTASILSLRNFGNCFLVSEDQRYNFLKTARLIHIWP